ncbi:7-carboxy-7-deazaguanine synthase QueE [bacterium]|nr:7-carboxy-7-deazaguanine synthase QueE [bacterium]
MKAKINEIFSSIQGEGPVVGYKQLFIRFCGCNLNCAYCDTEFQKGIEYSPTELYEKIINEFDLETFHSISLTGGEPLLNIDFLREFLPFIQGKSKIYLETNATLFDKLPIIKDYIDIISADIKLKSSTGVDTTELHKRFFKNCSGIETFAKIVFDKNITDTEILTAIDIAKTYEIELILQPKMLENKMSVSADFCSEILDKFTQNYKNVRLIPQVHKFLNVR